MVIVGRVPPQRQGTCTARPEGEDDDRGERVPSDDIVTSRYQEVVAHPKLGDVQVWGISDKAGGRFHPVHIHLVDFKILDRNGRAPFTAGRGSADVAYVGENETVRAVMRFGANPDDKDCSGRCMIHRHDLPHEDHDMKTRFRVGVDVEGPEGNNPIESDRPARLRPVHLAVPRRPLRPSGRPPCGAG